MKIRKINQELSLIIFGKVFQIIVLLMNFKISTSFLPPEQMGFLYVFMGVSSFFSFLLISPVGQYLNRQLPQWHNEEITINKFFNYNIYLIIAIGISIVFIYLANKYNIYNLINYEIAIIVIPIYLFINTWNQTLIPSLNLLYDRKGFTFLTILTLSCSLLCSYLLVKYFHNDALTWFIGQIIGLGLVSLYSLVYFIKKFHLKLNFQLVIADVSLKNLILIAKFVGPLCGVGILMWIQQQSYRLFIDKYLSSEFLGYFGICMTISSAICSSVESILIQFLYPDLYAVIEKKEIFLQIYSRLFSFIVQVYIALIIYISCIASSVMVLLTSQQYATVFEFLIFGMVIEFFRMLANLISVINFQNLQTRLMLIPYLFGSFATISLFFCAITFFESSKMVPIAMIIGNIIIFYLLFYRASKEISFHYRQIIKNLHYMIVFFIPLIWIYQPLNIFLSFLTIGIFGFYFLLFIYVLAKEHQIIGYERLM